MKLIFPGRLRSRSTLWRPSVAVLVSLVARQARCACFGGGGPAGLGPARILDCHFSSGIVQRSGLQRQPAVTRGMCRQRGPCPLSLCRCSHCSRRGRGAAQRGAVRVRSGLRLWPPIGPRIRTQHPDWPKHISPLVTPTRPGGSGAVAGRGVPVWWGGAAWKGGGEGKGVPRRHVRPEPSGPSPRVSGGGPARGRHRQGTAPPGRGSRRARCILGRPEVLAGPSSGGRREGDLRP